MSPERKSNGGLENHPPGIGERIVEIQSSAQHLIAETRDAVTDLRETLDLRERVQRHPYAMLGAAAALGYVLGGGLFTSMTAGLLRLGIRLAAVPLIKEELIGVAEGVLTDWKAKKGDGNVRPQETAKSG